MKSCLPGLVVLGRGGLGNQLFQINLAYRLENRFSSGISFLSHFSYRRREVDDFLSSPRSSVRKTGRILNILLNSSISRKLKIPRILGYSYLSEGDGCFQDLVSDVFSSYFEENRVMLDGYWQGIGASNEVSSELALDLLFYLSNSVTPPIGVSNGSKTLVAHVRRGDYILPHHQEIYGLVSLEKYFQLINQISGQCENLRIITVTDSDDLLRIEGVDDSFGTVLGPSDCSPWQVLKLFAEADIVISANSTLSWWGAYLASISGGEVYVPDPWFNSSHSNINLGLQIRGAIAYPSGI